MVPKPGEIRADADRSFERLYEGHRGEVYRAALRELGNAADAEDVTQAAFVDAYRALLRGSQPSAPRAWLLAIAENVRRRRFRTALRRPREEPLDLDAGVSTDPSDERADAVRSALVALPPQQRAVFLLREIAGLSYDEIAERLDSTVASVQMSLFRARRTLRTELEPPSVPKRGRALGLQLPPWLAHLVGRGDPLALTPRGAGALGAAVLALGGVSAGGMQLQRDDPRPAAVVREQHRALPIAAAVVPVAARQRPEQAGPEQAGAESKAAPATPAAPASPAPAPPTTPPEPVPAPAPRVAVSVQALEPAVETATAPVNVQVPASRGVVSPALPVIEREAPAVPALPPVVPTLPPVVPPAAPVVPSVLPVLPALVDPLVGTVPLDVPPEPVPLELPPPPPLPPTPLR